jgi:hypothetical protein
MLQRSLPLPLLLMLVCQCASARRPAPHTPDLSRLLDELRASQAAHQADDRPDFLAHARAAAQAAPAHPVAPYNLACALALVGQPVEAAAELDRLSAAGVAFDLDHDRDFDPIRQAPAFVAARERLEAVRARRIETSRVAFTLPDRDLLTEGIAYDSLTGGFYVSSVHQRKIILRTRLGRVADFAQSGLFGVLALAIDPQRRLLWACTSAMPEMNGFTPEDEGRAALIAFELPGGAERLRALLGGGGKHNCNDLALDGTGGVYVADPVGHAILYLAAGAQKLVPVATVRAPQGLVLEPNGHALLVADYGMGLLRLALPDGAVTPLAAPDDAVLTGIDGLCALPGGDLAAVQNGVEPHRTVRLRLSADRAAVREV